MVKEIKSFIIDNLKYYLEVLKERKENNWTLFAYQSSKRRAKRFWCNVNGQYKVILKSKTEPVYQGSDMEKACKIYETL